MPTVFPKNNLPEPAQPWAREVQKQLANVIVSNRANEINNATRDNQLNSSLISLTGVVADVKTAADEANAAINGLIGLGSAGGEYTINASNITAGTITGITIQSASSGTRVVMSSSQLEFYYASSYVGKIQGNDNSWSSAGALFLFSPDESAQVSVENGTVSMIHSPSSTQVALSAAGTNMYGNVRAHNSMRVDGSLDVLSTVFFPGLSSTTNTANVRVGTAGGGQIFVVTSARKYKIDIQDTHLSLEALNLRSRTWIDRGEYERNGNSAEGLLRIPGFVAEEVLEAGLSDFVLYDELGEIQGLSYDRMLASVIPVIKHHNDKITELNDRITTLENGAN